jgi:hypothetical protein
MIVVNILGWLVVAVLVLYLADAVMFGFALTLFYVLSNGATLKEWMKPRCLWFLVYSPWGFAWKRLTNDPSCGFASTSCGEWTFIPPWRIYKKGRRG